jgi:hypothetical protein
MGAEVANRRGVGRVGPDLIAFAPVWSDILTTDEAEFTGRALDALADVEWAQPLLVPSQMREVASTFARQRCLRP